MNPTPFGREQLASSPAKRCALRALREARTHGVLALNIGPCSDIHRRLAGKPVPM